MASTNVTTGTVVSLVRSLLTEKNTSGRWADADLIVYTDRAQKALAKAINWPDSVLPPWNTVNGTQEYDLSDNAIAPATPLKVLWVQIAGQPIQPTTISLLQGEQQEQYDDSNTPTMTTQWQSQAAATYPVISPTSFPVPTITWQPGLRPVYYLRGSKIGFVPKPAGVYPVNMGVVLPPATTTALADVLPFPDFAAECLAAKVMELSMRSDGDDQEANNQRAIFQSEIEGPEGLRAWVNGFQDELPDRPRPITYRTYYPTPFNLPTAGNR